MATLKSKLGSEPKEARMGILEEIPKLCLMPNRSKCTTKPYVCASQLKMLSIQSCLGNTIIATQVNEFFNAVDLISNSSQIRIAIRLMLILGLRISEIVSMRWEWFSADYLNLTLPTSMTSEIYTIPVPYYLVEILASYKDESQRHWALDEREIPPNIFWKSDGTARWIGFTNNTIQKAATEIGLEGTWRPYQLRTSCAGILKEVGIPSHYIYKLMRLRNRETMLSRVVSTHEAIRSSQSRLVDLFQRT